MKYALVLVIFGVVAAQVVLAQKGDHQLPSGDDYGKPGEVEPKLGLQRLRRQVPGENGQMGGSGSVGFSVGGQAGGQDGGQDGTEAGGQAGGQAGADGQFGFGGQAGISGGAGGGGGAGLKG